MRLRDDIVEGRLSPGSKISEPELARRYEISRSTLREALNRLEKCALIERRANIGARVVDCTVAGLRELYQVREALEGLACRLAAEHMNDQEIAELGELLRRHEQEVHSADGQCYYQEQGDVDFHYRVICGSKNQRLIQLLLNDLYHVIRMYRCQFGMNSPRASRAFIEHQRIYEAIAARDGELAQLLMQRHIAASAKNIEQRIQRGERHET